MAALERLTRRIRRHCISDLHHRVVVGSILRRATGTQHDKAFTIDPLGRLMLVTLTPVLHAQLHGDHGSAGPTVRWRPMRDPGVRPDLFAGPARVGRWPSN